MPCILPMLARRHMLWGGLRGATPVDGRALGRARDHQSGAERPRRLGLVRRVADRVRPRGGLRRVAGRSRSRPCRPGRSPRAPASRRRASRAARGARTVSRRVRGLQRSSQASLSHRRRLRCVARATRRGEARGRARARSRRSTRSTGANCAGCHGADGRLGPARPLNDPVYLAWCRRDRLRTIIRRGSAGHRRCRPSERAAGGELTDAQIEALVAGHARPLGRPDAVQGVTLAAVRARPASDPGARRAARPSTPAPVRGATARTAAAGRRAARSWTPPISRW